MKQEQRISNGVKKIFPILITLCLIFLFLPINTLGYWLMDDLFFRDIEPEIILKKGSLNLFWSADTYVPFGYPGRKLPTSESKITINAQLEILSGDPRSLKYSWFLDDIFQGSKSGYGQDSFQFYVKRSNNNFHTVSLKVFNESRSFMVEGSVTIPISKPDLLIYVKEANQINLPYTTSIKNLDVIADKESSFFALPYFFNIKSLKNLEFSWTFADETYKEPSLLANTANVFGLKIINKEARGLLEQTLKVVATNRRQLNQKIQETVKLSIY